MAKAKSFDPFNQMVIFHMRDGTPFYVSMGELDASALYNVKSSITYASQLGASLLLLIVLLLLTKPDKRRSLIFILNALTLSVNFIRNILLCVYFTSPWSEIYAAFAQDFSRVRRTDYANSVGAAVLSLLMLILVEVSLILQVRVVCVTLRKAYRDGLFIVSILVALMAIGFRFTLCVVNSARILKDEIMIPIQTLASNTNITTTASICWFCAIFVTKLGIALQARRKLGLAQFGPMQIIFIMGCQTLVIPGKSQQASFQACRIKTDSILPALFSILQYFVDSPELASLVMTLVAIFLPLSSLWASASISSRSQPTFDAEIRQKIVGSGGNKSSPTPFLQGQPHGPGSPTNSEDTRASENSVHNHHQNIDDDLEAQGLGEK
ncbi:MAG: hypothetical protein Q9191_007468 [Dirinaria sp. TL-2023a]